ncbi:Coenzyme Q-binding protein COQ10-like, mitochondrial [Vitis vinifera]|uniref:Coenzyme Q-binding protein COQ10-like, mitochondrial n=1 Tax=Vitis vinifera TaxID=29760 RepID=A0A438ITE1_VITVI|nr:Coenzyme Q-binding protein COQ10-like, mitochondrial [Vitis vinifera]
MTQPRLVCQNAKKYFLYSTIYSCEEIFYEADFTLSPWGGGQVLDHCRVSWYSPEQLFDVVAAVDLYHGFVPWCQQSEIIQRYPDGSFDAELEIGFKFLVENYVSHVELNRPKCIKVQSSEWLHFGKLPCSVACFLCHQEEVFHATSSTFLWKEVAGEAMSVNVVIFAEEGDYLGGDRRSTTREDKDCWLSYVLRMAQLGL